MWLWVNTKEVGHGICHEVIIGFCYVTSSVPKASLVPGLCSRKHREVESQRHKMDFVCFGKGPIINNWSALIAYGKCHFYLYHCSWPPEGQPLIMQCMDIYTSLWVHISDDHAGAWWWKLSKYYRWKLLYLHNPYYQTTRDFKRPD